MLHHCAPPFGYHGSHYAISPRKSVNDHSDRRVAREVMNLSISLDVTLHAMMVITLRKHETYSVVSNRIFYSLKREECDSFSEMLIKVADDYRNVCYSLRMIAP
jgi:pantothenate kinase